MPTKSSERRRITNIGRVRSGLSNLTSETSCNDLETFIDFIATVRVNVYSVPLSSMMFLFYVLYVFAVLCVRINNKYINILEGTQDSESNCGSHGNFHRIIRP